MDITLERILSLIPSEWVISDINGKWRRIQGRRRLP